MEKIDQFRNLFGVGFIACLMVALECVENALGYQSIFAQGSEWLWYIFVVGWGFNAYLFMRALWKSFD